ncbi:MAG: hypothetical protein JJT90_02585 [Ectothiorhodospiraceae bacterium]|nr:hypothetical protein [Ectothiorhodospiraceae bacterium]
MKPDAQQNDIPTLRELACPGEELAPRGLWLPVREPPPPQPPPQRPSLGDWQQRLPPQLRDRGPQLLDEVLERVRRHHRGD